MNKSVGEILTSDSIEASFQTIQDMLDKEAKGTNGAAAGEEVACRIA